MNPDQTKRLIAFLGMMGSDHDGEVCVAARKASQLLKDAGLAWPDVILSAQQSFNSDKKWTDADLAASIKLAFQQGYESATKDAQSEKPALIGNESFSDFAQTMLDDYPHCLSPWETSFCASWIRRRTPPSPKQMAIFERLSEKTGVPTP